MGQDTPIYHQPLTKFSWLSLMLFQTLLKEIQKDSWGPEHQMFPHPQKVSICLCETKWFCHFLGLWSWAGGPVSPCSPFLSCKKGKPVVPSWNGRLRELTRYCMQMDKHIPGTEKKPDYIASMIPESPDLLAKTQVHCIQLANMSLKETHWVIEQVTVL